MVFPLIAPDSVGWVDEAQMIEVDRVMIDDLGIDLPRMMENAGRNLARATVEIFDPQRVCVVVGSGGNGGGGMVAARHLTVAGVDTVVVPSRTVGELGGIPAQQMEILDRMGVRVADPDDEFPTCDVFVDALVGYSLRGAPRGRSQALIERLRGVDTVLALDTPSGLDVTTGNVPGIAVRADVTMTLALPKVGLRRAESGLVGRLLLADISVPPSVTQPLGGAPDFRRSTILEIADA